MVPISLVPALTLLYFYVSTFRSMCAVPNMAVFCSSLTSWFPGMFIIIIIIIINNNNDNNNNLTNEETIIAYRLLVENSRQAKHLDSRHRRARSMLRKCGINFKPSAGHLADWCTSGSTENEKFPEHMGKGLYRAHHNVPRVTVSLTTVTYD
jgi:hypothetical protein